MFSLPRLVAADGQSEDLLQKLRLAESAEAAQRLENQLMTHWSKSGSPAMDLLYQRGHDALAAGRQREAAEHFQALTDHAPDFAEGWHGLALTYFKQERLGPAALALEQVLRLNPDHFAAVRGVGALHEQLGNPALAYKAYEQVLEARPFDSDVTEALERLKPEVQGQAL
jgi:tetratricopeptide (TPR) repeat protein